MRLAPTLIARILLAAALSATAVSAVGAASPDNLSNNVTSNLAQAPDRVVEMFPDATARTRSFNPKADATSRAQDLAIFGLIGLGIVGLLWIRRHTSEL